MLRAMERVTLEKMVFGGQAMGRDAQGRVVFAWNALPGEEGEIELTKTRRGHREGILRVVHVASPNRIDPVEPEAYLSTSPWQMMTFDAEQLHKQESLREVFLRVGGFDPGVITIQGEAAAMYGYRNKMEFSFFTETKESPIQLCFYGRGTHSKVPVSGSALAEPVINVVARTVVTWLNTQKINRLDLKSLVIRSNGKGEAIAALFVKHPQKFAQLPRSDAFRGFHIYYSDPKSPASVPTRLLASWGDASLTATIQGTDLQFGLLSFFQVNQGLFARTLDKIAEFVGEDTSVVDLYSGVGSIGIPLATRSARVTLVEINSEANQYARHNVAANGLRNVEVIEAPAEQALQEIVAEKLLILDPPRAGVHTNVLDRILEVRPPKIAYLSCNGSTQARDVGQLLGAYTLLDTTLYNYFPRTPHVESLMLLVRKEEAIH